jgi:hypothetical protein
MGKDSEQMRSSAIVSGPDEATSQVIDFGREVIMAALKVGDAIRYDGNHAGSVQALALYGSIVELYAGCLELAESDGATAGIPVLLRSMFEALVDVDNRLRDAAYVERMEAANLNQILKLLDDERSNPLVEGLQARRDVAAETAAVRTRLAELTAKGATELSLSTRCTRVDRGREYRSFYRLFCLDSDNNIAALEGRHVERTDEGGARVSIFGSPDPASVRRRISFGAGFLLEAAMMISLAFRLDVTALVALDNRRRVMGEQFAEE